jgi:hypothetical protein
MLTDFKKWAKLSRVFNSFSMERLTSPTTRMAVAEDKNGTPIVFCAVEKVALIRNFCVDPKAGKINAQLAGDQIDAQLAWQCAKEGIQSYFIVVPSGQQPPEGFSPVLMYERTIEPLHVAQFDAPTKSHAENLIN